MREGPQTAKRQARARYGVPSRPTPARPGLPHLTLPSLPRVAAVPPPADEDDAPDDWEIAEAEQAARDAASPRTRQRSQARPLALMRVPQRAVAPLEARSTALVPELAASARVPALRKSARQRRHVHPTWMKARALCALLAIAFAVLYNARAVGEPSQPLMAGFATSFGAQRLPTAGVASRVQPLTQGTRTDQYDSLAQFNQWWGAACSAAVLAEVLTAYGERNVTIGRMINDLGSGITPYAGLLGYDNFQRVAAKYGYRADHRVVSSYDQLLHLTNDLGLPVIVNVRVSYGYYHFFSGGHFLVMTGGDPQGLRIVDSSLYYIKYLPLDVFRMMYTNNIVVIVPRDYQYTL